jgi:hypothetical protein
MNDTYTSPDANTAPATSTPPVAPVTSATSTPAPPPLPPVQSVPAGFSKYDISTEYWRTYHYANGDTYRIESPELLFTKNVSGFVDTHRVVDVYNVTHCPTKGWINISWYAPNEPVSF